MNGSRTLPTKVEARQQHAHCDAEQRSTAVTDERLAQRYDQMLEQIVLRPIPEMAQHPQRAREPKRVEPAVGAVFPDREKHDRENHPNDHQLPFFAALQRLPRTNVVLDIGGAGRHAASPAAFSSVLATARLPS